MNQAKSIILFDIDGTLIDAARAPRRAFERAFRGIFHVDPVTESVVTHGATDPQIRRDIALATFSRDFSPSEYTQLNTRYVELLYAEIDADTEYRVMPGVGELLGRLTQQSGVVVGLQTGNLAEAVPAKLGRGQLNHYFKVGGFGTDSSCRAEIIRIAVARAKEMYALSTANIVNISVIGDTPQDIHAALEVGARAIGVATGVYSATHLKSVGAHQVFDTLSDVSAAVSLLCAGSFGA